MIIEIDFWGMFQNILLVIVVPVGIGCVLSYCFLKRNFFAKLQQLMPDISVICLALVIGGVISAVREQLLAGGWNLFLLAFVVVFCYNELGYLVGYCAGTPVFQKQKTHNFNRSRRANAVLGTVLAATFFARTFPIAVLPCVISCVWHSISGIFWRLFFVITTIGNLVKN